MKKIMALLLTLVMLLSLTACGSKTENHKNDADMIDVKVAYMPNWGALWAASTADAKGYFADEGLNVTFYQVEEGPTEIAALESGTIDVAYIGQGPHKLCAAGSAKVFLLQHLGQADFIIGFNGIKSMEDMKGKKVGYVPGTASETLLSTALEAAGMTLDDIDAAALIPNSMTAAALSSQLDAVSIWNPFAGTILRENADAVKICTNGDFSSLYSLSSWVANPDWAENNRDTLVKFTRAMYRAMDYAAQADTDDAVAQEVAGYIADIIKTDPEDVLEQRYDGTWLTRDDVTGGIESGSLLDFYTRQQDAFIAMGIVDGSAALSPEQFVLTDIMTEAAK